MVDLVDEAQLLQENRLTLALSKLKKPAIPFSGFCLFCEEPVGKQRFCDSLCREAHEQKQKRGP